MSSQYSATPSRRRWPLPRRHSKRAGVGLGVGTALIAGTALGTLGSTLMPVLLPEMGDRYGISNTGTGAVATAQLVMTALVTLALMPRVARPGRARIAQLGVAAAAAGFTLAAVAPDLTTLVTANIVAGAGLGAVNAAAMAAIASTDDSDRASSIAVVGAIVVAAVLMTALPEAQALWGEPAQFALLAFCCLPALWLLRTLPEPTEQHHEAAAGPPVPVSFLAAVALLGASDQGAWSYSATLGEQHNGMTPGAVSTVLAVASIASLAGVGLNHIALRTCGRIAAIAVLITVEGLAKLLIALVPSPAVFTAAAIVWQVCFMGLLVALLAVAASVDSSGRWVAGAGGALAIGTALGPAPSGWILDTWGAPAFGLAITLTTALAAIPLLRTTHGALTAEATAAAALPGHRPLVS
ncbi:MFS transporter [Streptomyces hydrogenans]|uniref:MFS transporter n=1 Tax=Streptomyces hydrogenans TaxID=1873719 RepID=UPI00342257D3